MKRAGTTRAGALGALVCAALLAADAAWASGAVRLGLVRGSCDPRALAALRDEIASAPSVAEARELAAPPLGLARSALAKAQRLVPWGLGLEQGEQRLRAGERAIAAAATPAAVASAFGTAITGDPALAGVDIDPPSCSYSTVEIIAIVLGFILGIIPGLILLVLLC